MTRRAFTLIEILVASVIAIIIVSIILSIFAQVERSNARAHRQNALFREAAFAVRVMEHDLRNTGLGVPQGGHIQRRCAGNACAPVYGTIAPARFKTSVIVAAPAQVGVVGDLARPNAQYNTFGMLASFRTGSPFNIMWHTENNGLCAPRAGPGSCSTADTSFFFPGEGGCTANPNDRVCPWGMNRVQPGDRIQIVAGDTNWSHAGVSPFGLGISTDPAVGNVVGLALTTPFDRPGGDTVWFNDARAQAGPGGIVGAGFVTTLDRVFYFHDASDRTIKRVQCWGDPDPDSIGWPDGNAAAIPTPIPAALKITPPAAGAATAQNECTDPEIVARFVDLLDLSYFDKDGARIGALTNVTAKASVRRIDFRILFRIPGDGAVKDVLHEANGSVLLHVL